MNEKLQPQQTSMCKCHRRKTEQEQSLQTGLTLMLNDLQILD